MRWIQIGAVWLTTLTIYLVVYRKYSIGTIPLYRLWYRIRDGKKPDGKDDRRHL